MFTLFIVVMMTLLWYVLNKIYLSIDFTYLYSLFDVDWFLNLYEKNTWIYNIILYCLESFSSFVSFIPFILMFLMVLCLSSFYLVFEQDVLKTFLLYIFEFKIYHKIKIIFFSCQSVIFSYCKTQLCIMIITNVLLYFVFSLLNIQNSLFYSCILSILDTLPVFGVGIGLVPMMLFYAYKQLYFNCVYIFLVFLFLTLMRSIVETNLMKQRIKIPSFLLLLSMMIHLYVYGVCGVILSILHMNIAFGYLEYRKDIKKMV